MTYISPPAAPPDAAWQRALRRLAIHIAEAWQRYRTERAIESMSFHMRKDIGWPSSTAAPTPRKPT